MRILTSSLLVLFLVFSGGCSTVAMLKEPPKVKLKDVRLKDTDLKTAVLDIILEVDNKNPVAATVKSLKYNLSVNEKQLADGIFDQPVELAANQITMVAIPVSVKLEDIVSSAFALLQNRGAPYRAKGSVGVGLFEIPFDETGKIELDKP